MRRLRLGRVLMLAGAMVSTSLAMANHAWAQDMTFTSDVGANANASAVTRDGPPSEAMANALRLYQQERYPEAAVQFQRVVEGETHDAQNNVEKAQFFLGKCLYYLHYYQSALAVFDEIVNKGAEHTQFKPTLRWLAQLASQLPEPADIISRVGKYALTELEEFNNDENKELYNQLLYLLGRSKYKEGDFDTAIELFGKVAIGTRSYVQAQFFQGISYIRSRRVQPAVDSFNAVKAAVQKGAPGVEDPRRMLDLAWLELARIFYTTDHLPSAVEAWNQIEVDSEYWLDAMFEESWAYFKQEDYARALGNIHTLNSPYFQNSFYPESLILKSVILYANCQYEDAETVVAQFTERYGKVRETLGAYLEKFGDNAAFFQFLKDVRSGSAKLDPKIQPIVETALGDRTLLRNIEYVAQLEDEERLRDQAPAPFKNSSLGERILQDISIAKSQAIDSAGDLAKDRYNRLLSELQDLENQSTAIMIEILAKQRDRENQTAAGQGAAPIQPIVTKITADDEHFLWPFNGEFWRDELPFYRQQVKDSCGR